MAWRRHTATRKSYFLSNLPPRPRHAILTSQPRTVEYGLVSPRAMDRIPLPSLRLQQATRTSLALPGDDHSIMRQIFSLLVPGRNSPPPGSLSPLRTGARECAMRARNTCPDQNLSVNGRGHLNSDGKLAKHFGLAYALAQHFTAPPFQVPDGSARTSLRRTLPGYKSPAPPRGAVPKPNHSNISQSGSA